MKRFIICLGMMFIIGLILGAAGVFFVLRPRLKEKETLDTSIIQQNKILKEESVQLLQQYNDLQKDIAVLETSRKDLKNTIFNLQEQAEKSASELSVYAKDICVCTPVSKGCKIVEITE